MHPIRRPPFLAIPLLAAACLGAPTTVPPSSGPSTPLTSTTSPTASIAPQSPAGPVLLAGRVVTMADPAEVEALLIVDGRVAAIGSRADVGEAAPPGTKVIELGSNVAYPGFIDAHAHWIGDRNYYGIETPAEAMAAAAARGWTSISEQWVDGEKLEELEGLAGSGALPLRVDAYLALNGVRPGEHYGDWYADRAPGPVADHLRVRGLKIHLDSGTGAIMLWEHADLTGAIGRANAAGWQVSVHTVSTEAHAAVLDAFEAAIGPTGANPLHHRLEHALQMRDEHFARIVAMDLTTVIQLDGVGTDWVMWAASAEEDPRDYREEDVGWLARWRDLVDAGLHVAASSDAPWFFPAAGLVDDVGRPVDEIAGGMDGRGRSFPETPEWMREQLLTAEQGLRAVTLGAAWALGDEKNRGHLAVGAYGDVTILDRDVRQASPDEIRSTIVVATVVDGVSVFCGEGAACP